MKQRLAGRKWSRARWSSNRNVSRLNHHHGTDVKTPEQPAVSSGRCNQQPSAVINTPIVEAQKKGSASSLRFKLK